MNYTENYHLPQWVKEDRIMMEDFNQMCADIESGLTGTSADMKSLATQQKKTMDCLQKLAYNHYRTVQDLEPIPCQLGIFHQNFEKDASGLTGTTRLNGRHFAGKSTKSLSLPVFLECYEQLEPMHMVKDDLAASTPLTATLRIPATGSVNNYKLEGNYSNNTPGVPFRFQVTLTNQDTGGVEQISEITIPNEYTGAGFSYYVKTPLYFLGGVNYLITMKPLSAPCDMEAWLKFSESGVGVYSNKGIVTAETTVQEPEGGEGGMAVLHFVTGGDGGDLTFLWDGVERQPDIMRMVRMNDGRDWTEYLYLRDDEIPKISTLSLQFQCKPDGSILLYDWGMILL